MVKLIPPVLNSTTILKRLTGTRPMREGRFNISISEFPQKKIVHCYGMGGSGWTTLFGSVAKAIRLFEEDAEKKTAIRVIGSGCMGLTSAIELARKGYKVAGITTKELYDIPSWRAAGLFGMISLKTSPEEMQNLEEIGIETFAMLQAIDRGDHPYISRDSVRFMPAYASEETEVGVEGLEAKGLLPPCEEVDLEFEGGRKHLHFLKHMTYFMNTARIMQQLTAEVKRLCIPIEIDYVNGFDRVKESIIFNCSGIGARELNRDELLIPVRGHLVSLNKGAGVGHMDYMLCTKVHQEGNEEYIYMFPKSLEVVADEPLGIPCHATLGGTFIPHADRLSEADLAELDRLEFHKLLDRNSLFFYGTPFPQY